jgi:hypothetical protein
MPSGFPSGKAIIETDLPRIVGDIRKYINKLLAGKQFSIGVDGGKADLGLGGTKVVAYTAMAPYLPFDVVLGLQLLSTHENSKLQARYIRSFLFKSKMHALYSLERSQLQFLAADGSALNPKTVKRLNTHDGFDVTYARCVAHAFSNVMVSLLAPFDSRFGMTTFFRMLRGLIKAGGGTSRNALCIEYGVSTSSIDFSDTRWEGLIAAVKHIMGTQSEFELKRAATRLQVLADEGDASAVEALASPAVARRRWDVWFEVAEEILEGMAG